VTAGKLGGQVLEVVAWPCGRLDADGEGVAADADEVLAEQVSGSRGLAGRRGGDHFDVMAFPVHSPASGLLVRCAGEGAEVGDGEAEAGVGADGQAQGCGGPVRAGCSLARRYHAAARRLAVTTRPWSSTAGPVAVRGGMMNEYYHAA
jgi:hypothetical protein